MPATGGTRSAADPGALSSRTPSSAIREDRISVDSRLGCGALLLAPAASAAGVVAAADVAFGGAVCTLLAVLALPVVASALLLFSAPPEERLNDSGVPRSRPSLCDRRLLVCGGAGGARRACSGAGERAIGDRSPLLVSDPALRCTSSGVDCAIARLPALVRDRPPLVRVRPPPGTAMAADERSAAPPPDASRSPAPASALAPAPAILLLSALVGTAGSGGTGSCASLSSGAGTAGSAALIVAERLCADVRLRS